ncbi:hypothetical protein AMTRI_Chr02g217260 [Amborella trichopoda]
MDWSHYPLRILMVHTVCPSSLDLEGIASYLALYLPFYPVLSPICRISSSLLSFYRAHGHPLIPRTAFPLLEIPIPLFHLALNPSFIVGHIIESGAFSSSDPLPLLLPPPCFSPSSLSTLYPRPPPPSPLDPACLLAFNLTQSLLHGPLTLSLNSSPIHKNMQEASLSREKSLSFSSPADINLDTIKEKVMLFSKLWVSI